MTEREKVFDAFRNCITEPKCRDCPWESCEAFVNPKVEIPKDLALAVIRMLVEQEPIEPKAQEPVKPEFGGLPSGTIGCTRWYICGQCKYEIDPGDKFCRHCGRKVKWDE